MSWEWLNVAHAAELTSEEEKLFKLSVNRIYNCILENESVLIHCSAGLHRTGMFAYAVLRKGGVEQDVALDIIKEIRPETFEALENKYIEVAERLY